MYRKVYVDVDLTQTKDGHTIPHSITFENGIRYPIDRLRSVCKAASTKVGGCGIRYTIVVNGHETFLFEDERKWYVEAKPAT
jgi:hypothetical protein